MDGTFGFGPAAHDLGQLDDREFLRRIRWSRTAPPDLIDTARAGEVGPFLSAWRAARPPAPADVWLSGWSAAAFGDQNDRLRAPQTRSGRTAGPSTQQRWIRGLARDLAVRTGPLSPLERLAMLELLQRACDLPDELYWLLWRRAASSVRTSTVPTTNTEQPPDEFLLAQGELAWLGGLFFDGVAGASRLRNAGQRTLTKGLLDRTDTDGLPHADLLPRLSLWLAPLVRAVEWARAYGVEIWSGESAKRYEALIKASASLLQDDGRLALCNGLPLEPLPVLQAALAHLRAGSSAAAKYIRSVANPSRRKTAPRAKRGRVLPGAQSDWARLACLRSDLSPKSDSLAVTHNSPAPRIELTALGRGLLKGHWEVSLQIDGRPVALADEWDCVCWQSDEDVDYLELQMHVGRGRIERQLLLARRDRFLLAADCLCDLPRGRIELTARLPLYRAVSGEPVAGERGLQLSRPGLSARAFPLALPQDRVQSTAGDFCIASDAVELRQVAEGSGLYAPLVIDWHPQRKHRPADWRSLTVSEAGRKLSGDRAAGHRLRIGRHQLLVYRSLNPSENSRAVLGHHTSHETVIGQFDANGDVTPLLLVE